jgi:hypothetical protein
MKSHLKNILLIALLLPGIVLAQEAYVIPKENPQESIIQRGQIIYALYLNEKCQLHIANAENMRKAAIFNTHKPDKL